MLTFLVVSLFRCINFVGEKIQDHERKGKHLLCKVVAGTDKEEVADNVADHLLVQVPVVDVLPVRVLQMME